MSVRFAVRSSVRFAVQLWPFFWCVSGGQMFHCKNFRGHLEKVSREIPPCGLPPSLRPAAGLLYGLLTLPDASRTLMVYLWCTYGYLWVSYGVSLGIYGIS